MGKYKRGRKETEWARRGGLEKRQCGEGTEEKRDVREKERGRDKEKNEKMRAS